MDEKLKSWPKNKTKTSHKQLANNTCPLPPPLPLHIVVIK